MDKQFFKFITQEMRDAGVEELGLFYLGESMMVPWIDEACAHAKKIGFPYVFLTTNGSLAEPERLDSLFRAGLDSLKFSLNYADKQQFTEIARVKGIIYDVMIANIKAARSIRDQVEQQTGHRCGLYASYILYDGAQGEKMKERVEELSEYLDEIYELPLYNQASLVMEDEKAMGWKASPGNRGRAAAMVQPIPCWACFTEGHITWDGLLSACCFDHNNAFTMADLNEVGFMDGWHSATFQALRRAHLNKDVRGTACESCLVRS